MLEILIPGIRYGDGIVTTTAHRGSICYISGFNSDGKALLRVPYNSAQAKAAVYPVNKIYYGADYGDTSTAIDVFVSLGNEECVYYEGGQYETDEWYPSSFGLTAAYWYSVEYVSSPVGGRMYSPGFSTTLSTLGVTKCYPCALPAHYQTGKGCLGARRGMIVGLASAAGINAADGSNAYFAIAVGLHGSSSADAHLVFRIVKAKHGATL